LVMMSLRLLALALLVSAASAANPIRRVVNMLQDMQKNIEAEGERDKELFDKFMCYCTQGKVDLEKAVKDAETKIPATRARLQEAQSQKEQFEADLKKHKASLADAEGALGEAAALRSKEAAAFKTEYVSKKTYIKAIEKAIKAILGGIDTSFLQTDTAAVIRRLIVEADLKSMDRDVMASFLSQKQEDSDAAPKSSQIVGILKAMLEDMKDDLKNMKKDETSAKASFSAMSDAKEEEVKSNSMSIEEKTERVGKLGVEIEELREDLEDTEASFAEDKKFLKDMDKTCATKKDDWDAVQKTRAEELLAISETIKILNDDDALDLFKKTLPSTSLLQVAIQGRDARQRALRALSDARQSRDTRLDLIALAIHGKKYSFDKVLTMIDQMQKLLRAEQISDDEKKTYCDKEIGQNERDYKKLEKTVSDLTKSIDETEEAIATFGEELEALAEGIKALDKSVADATANRKAENKEYKDTMAQNTAAKELLKMAKKRLNQFYNPKQASALQQSTGSDIAGKSAPTLVQVSSHMRRSDADGAPRPPAETFGAYTKKGGESSGVITMVDTLIADLDKEMTEMGVEEKDTQDDYEKYVTDSAAKRAADSKSIEEKEAAKASAEESLGKAKLEKKSTKKEAYASAMLLRDLHLECDWLVTNYDTRQKARSGEIDALKKAHEVLSGADLALLQTTVRGQRRTSSLFLGHRAQ